MDSVSKIVSSTCLWFKTITLIFLICQLLANSTWLVTCFYLKGLAHCLNLMSNTCRLIHFML